MRRTGWLTTINPVMKLAATLLPMLAVMFTRDWFTPGVVVVGAVVGIVTGVRLSKRTLLWGAVAVLTFGLWMTFFFALLVRDGLVASTPVLLDWPRLHVGAVEIGAATALRMLAVMLLALLGSLGSTTPRLVSALVNQCKVPYRFAYGTAAAVQFVPRYRDDLATLRAAHRARGIIDPPGPLGYARRTGRSLVPLLAGGVRHAGRLSLAMDARGFGAHPRRTDRDPTQVRPRDVVMVVAVWALTATVFLVAARLGMLQLTGQWDGHRVS